MLTREMIIKALTEKGMEAQATDVTKNGVTLQGIALGTGTVRPTIYIEQFVDYADDEVEDVVDAIMYQYNKAIEDVPVIDVYNLLNWDYAKTRLQLCIQQKGNEDIVKRDFLDLEEYVRVIASTDESGMGSFKVRPEHLERFGITEETLFHAAWDCTAPTIKIEDMSQMVPMPEGMMIVATNETKLNGAIAMKATEKLAEVADKYGKQVLAILPSSIHEILLVPLSGDESVSNLDKMVQDVNATQLAPEEVLSNHAYIYGRAVNKMFCSLNECTEYLNALN